MRKVNGNDIARNELKKYWFGYNEEVECAWTELVDYIEIENSIFGTNEEGTMYVRFPKQGIANIDEDWHIPDGFIRNKPLTVYDFIENYYCLDEKDLGEFTFYFAE